MIRSVTSVAARPGPAHAGSGRNGGAVPPGGFDAAWQEGRETTGRPLWAVPLVLAVWAIGVPLALSLWWSDDGDAAAGVAAPPAAVCADLAAQLELALKGGDAPRAARLGHEQGYRRCPSAMDDR
ncbi:MAG: hypothetical protein RIB84_01635 [Sneathiellaceae bacterium]